MKNFLGGAILIALLAACEPPVTELRMIESPASIGLSLREVPQAALKEIGLKYGLAVVRTGGLAERAGLRLGDVIHGVNQQRIARLEDFYRLVDARTDGNLALLVRRGKADVYVAMDVGARPGAGARGRLLRT